MLHEMFDIIILLLDEYVINNTFLPHIKLSKSWLLKVSNMPGNLS